MLYHLLIYGYSDFDSGNENIMGTAEVKEINSVLPFLLKFKNVWANYDLEADVLYIHFKKPNHADSTEITENNINARYEKDEVIGLSVLNASKRLEI